ncbi:MAG: hypothetical protein FWF41_04675 [Betaproteobacteria bacterium]|nr:hypothetical protein [Betaproteobacteria bacterium]
MVDLSIIILVCIARLNSRAVIRPDLAVRLEMAGVSSARAWLSMQANDDLAQAMKNEQPPAKALATA